MVKQTAKVISSDSTTGHQVILAGRTKYTVMYDDDGMLSYIEVEGGARFSDKELLSLIARTTLLRVDLSADKIWSYYSRVLTNLLGHILLTEFRLDGGTTQLLIGGWWTLRGYTDAGVPSDWGNLANHVEAVVTGAWKDYLIAGDVVMLFSDGTNFRLANGAGAGTWYRFIGVRAW